MATQSIVNTAPTATSEARPRAAVLLAGAALALIVAIAGILACGLGAGNDGYRGTGRGRLAARFPARGDRSHQRWPGPVNSLRDFRRDEIGAVGGRSATDAFARAAPRRDRRRRTVAPAG